MPRRAIRARICATTLALLAGGASGAEPGDLESFEMGGGRFRFEPRALYVEPSDAGEARRAFVQALRSSPRPYRPLFEEYLDRIGANGILDGIEALQPKCHSEAHDLGKVIFARLGSVGDGLRACDDRCSSGCMHGVLMEAFSGFCNSDGTLRLELLVPSMNNLCLANETMAASYSRGDCGHGVGHALTFLTRYDIGRAVEACQQFQSEPLRFYCATGAYMEYVIERDAADADSKPLFYPCDRYAFPAACGRYKMVRILHRLVLSRQSPQRLIDYCGSLSGAVRLGCFHGLGNAFMPWVAAGEVELSKVCRNGTTDDQHVCIEGAMERMSRYQPERAVEVCASLEEGPRRICAVAVEQGMYSMTKDFDLYLPREN